MGSKNKTYARLEIESEEKSVEIVLDIFTGQLDKTGQPILTMNEELESQKFNFPPSLLPNIISGLVSVAVEYEKNFGADFQLEKVVSTVLKKEADDE